MVVASFTMRKRASSSTMCRTSARLLSDALRLPIARPPIAVAPGRRAFLLRKQLALYQERRVNPRRADDALRITLVTLARLIDWRVGAHDREVAGVARLRATGSPGEPGTAIDSINTSGSWSENTRR